MHPEEDHQQEENEEDHLILYGDHPNFYLTIQKTV